MELTKECKVCGNEFTAKSNKAVYCNGACKHVDYRKRKKMESEDEFNQNLHEKQNEFEEIKEKFAILEQNQQDLQRSFIEVPKLMVDNFVSKDTIEQISEDLKENNVATKDLSKTIETLKIEKKELKEELHKLKFDFEEIK